MFKNVLVLGGGSAGLMAALSLKTKLPELTVTVLRSPEIGVIGVGESTTPFLPYFLFDYLKVSRRKFYETAQPTWKLGIHFIWGKRGAFEYSFEPQMEFHPPELARPIGYYLDDDANSTNMQSAMLFDKKAFYRQPNGSPGIRAHDPFHLENPKFVKALEGFCLERGVVIIDGKMSRAEKGPEGIAALHLEDGRRLTADFFIDASGFRSELLGKTMEEPYIPFSNSLFNDRALVGSWDRTEEHINPFTTAETMEAGWCWRIDHEKHINRGYVYSSGFLTDEQAREEFVRKNPKIKPADRPIKFRSGRYERAWVGNVMGIGNAAGFVEPLESTAIMIIAEQCELFCDLIRTVGISPTVQSLFNKEWATDWDEVRDFLTLHFWANTKIDNPYWKHCNHETDITRVKPLLDFYMENGPSTHAQRFLRARGNQFGINGTLVMLIGCKTPYKNHYTPTEKELQYIAQLRANCRATAQQAVDVKEALSYIRHPNWRWAGET